MNKVRCVDHGNALPCRQCADVLFDELCPPVNKDCGHGKGWHVNLDTGEGHIGGKPMTFNVYLQMQDRWCRVGHNYVERARAQRLADDLTGEGNAVKIVLFEPGAERGTTIWESKRP